MTLRPRVAPGLPVSRGRELRVPPIQMIGTADQIPDRELPLGRGPNGPTRMGDSPRAPQDAGAGGPAVAAPLAAVAAEPETVADAVPMKSSVTYTVPWWPTLTPTPRVE